MESLDVPAEQIRDVGGGFAGEFDVSYWGVLSDMHCLALHVRANFFPKRLLRDQVHSAAEHTLQVKQDPKILSRISGSVEADQNIDITALMSCVSRS